LLAQIQLHKLELPECDGSLLQIAAQKPGLRGAVAGLFAQYGTFSGPVVAFLKAVALDGKEDSALRLKAFEALTRASGQPEAAEAAVSVLVASSQSPDAGAIAKRLREAFMRDVQQGRNSDYFEKLATSGSASQKEVAFAVLLELSSNSNAPKRAKAA